MIFKWHDRLSSKRDLHGGGPQGSTLGILEYISQSNDNAHFVSDDLHYKFIDDLSLLEIVNLVSSGLCSYNFRNHVASDIGINQKFLPPTNIDSQKNIDSIQEWTTVNKIKINEKKTKVIIFNQTYNYQFSTRIYIKNILLDIIQETKLLGLILTSKLDWNKNTEILIKKSYSRMEILRNLFHFNMPTADLITIYIIYIRSFLEQSCVVWHSSISEENTKSLERVQKVALRIILKEGYISYKHALEKLTKEPITKKR